MSYDYVKIADWDNRTAKIEADIDWITAEVSCSVDKFEEVNRRLDEMENRLSCRILMKKGFAKDKPEQYSIRIVQGIYIDDLGELFLVLDDKEESWEEKEIEKNIFLN